MNVKKWLYTLLLFIFVFIVFGLYNSFNGNPLSKYMSKRALENFLEEAYPDQEFQVDDGVYNFKFNAYHFEVIEIGNIDDEGNVKKYEFQVSGFFNPVISWDDIYYESLDEELSNQLSKQAQKEITEILQGKLDSIHLIEVYIEVLQDKFDENVQWGKDLPLDKPMDIYIQIDSTIQTKEEFLVDVKQIKSILHEQGYEYDGIIFNGMGFDLEGIDEEKGGYVKYFVSVDKNGEVNLKDIEELNEDLW